MLLHGVTIFLSASLLFLVQPIIASQILPWFGGAAAVWAICLVFFQSVLLLGYAYADWTTRHLTPRRQALLHIGLLAVSLTSLPIVPDARWKPATAAEPTLAILGLLGATIGLPYFVLSTTTSLVQGWLWQRFPQAAPYRLFALSNLAALLALLSYPVLIEPFVRLSTQSDAWSIGYAVFACLCGATALSRARGASPAAPGIVVVQRAVRPIAVSDGVLWVALSAMASCLLLAVTNHFTQNIAPVPLLWIVPLSIYLVTLILCFDHSRWYRRGVFFTASMALLPAMAWWSDSMSLYWGGPLYAAGLFSCCMFCHGELTRLKPGPERLTTFYVLIALGGAIGSLLVGIAAPNLLHGSFELGGALIACGLLLVSRSRILGRRVVAASVAIVVATAVAIGINLVIELVNTRVMVRNFYGVVRTRDYPQPVAFRVMYHGAIHHGGQLLDPAMRDQPSSYFARTSGYGRVFESLPSRPRRVGVVGLGAGAMAAYGRQGDVFRFYELDPQVEMVARSEFTFLADSPAHVEIQLGDGRLSLEREPDQNFDFLALDAFSGDAIPLHLLTREAMATYVRHIKPGGVIAFQATNRFVDIAPVVGRLATEFGLTAVMVSDRPSSHQGADYWTSATDQILVTGNQVLLHARPIVSVAGRVAQWPDSPVWTDDFHNLLRILKR